MGRKTIRWERPVHHQCESFAFASTWIRAQPWGQEAVGQELASGTRGRNRCSLTCGALAHKLYGLPQGYF